MADNEAPSPRLTNEQINQAYAAARGLSFAKKPVSSIVSESKPQPENQPSPPQSSSAKRAHKARQLGKDRELLQRVSVRLTGEMVAFFEEQARKEDRSAAWVIRKALEDYCKRVRRQTGAARTDPAETSLTDETSKS